MAERCIDYGNALLEGKNFCTKCGARLGTGESIAQMPANKGSSSRERWFLWLSFISIAIIVNVVFVPMFSHWGGLFPSRSDIYYTFPDVIHNINRGRIQTMTDVLSLFTLIPAIVLWISSIAKGKTLSVLSSFCGAGLLFLSLIEYISRYGTRHIHEIVFSKRCVFAIGFWIALLLFVVCFFISVGITKRKTIRVECRPRGRFTFCDFYEDDAWKA